MSLPSTAEALVNWVPASCMPSPESPAKRIVTDSSSSSGTWRDFATDSVVMDTATSSYVRAPGVGGASPRISSFLIFYQGWLLAHQKTHARVQAPSRSWEALVFG